MISEVSSLKIFTAYNVVITVVLDAFFIVMTLPGETGSKYEQGAAGSNK